MIEGHGDDGFRYGNRVKINFSSNIPQKVDHKKLMRHLYGLGDIFRNYPEPSPESVENLIASQFHLDGKNVMVTNGATETIYLLAHLFIDKRSAILIPTFREYQDACKLFSHQIRFISSTEMIPMDCDIVWLCNPNNPTGLTFDYDKLLYLINHFRNILFVIDQAYGLYSVKEVLTPDDVLKYGNVILLQSFTKRFAVPGLRIGYAIGSDSIINNLKLLRMPWSVNAVAIEAAKYLLSHESDYRTDYFGLHDEALRVITELRKSGYYVGDTDCNFFLAQTHSGTSAALKEWLVENYGILIRDASNFEGLTEKHFRIAVQSEKENDILIKALQKWIRLS